MKWHRFKLWLLTNRNNFLFYMASVAMLSTFIVNLFTLQQILAQSQRNEQILKGLSCILLIAPEDRNKNNVEKCIDKNAPVKDEPFQFNTFDAPTKQSDPSQIVTMTMPSQPIVIVPKSPAVPPQVQQPEIVNPTPTPLVNTNLPQIKEYTRVVNGRKEYRYEGDLQWQVDL